ncbi:MAG TPA: universal stress protein [Nitrososphaeraceae archaeon]
MFNKIIVPVDGSKPAEKALEHAINLAKSISVNDSLNKIEIIMLFVIPELPAKLGIEPHRRSMKTGEVISFSEYVNEMYELKRSNAIKLLYARKKRYESYRIKDNDFILRDVLLSQDKSISDTILEFAKKEKADLIVIGNIGLSGISKLKTLGSVSRSIAEKSSCPVLIVHQ